MSRILGPGRPPTFRDPGAAEGAGYVLAVAGILVACGLVLHPLPSGGFAERATILAGTPLWGAIHMAIAAGFVLSALGGLLMLLAGGPRRHWSERVAWGSIVVGMIFFTGVAMINAWVMHPLSEAVAMGADPRVFDAFNRLLVGYGWLGNPLFLAGLTTIATLEVHDRAVGLPAWLAWAGLIVVLLSWLRGVGSATGLFFLEPLVLANVPAFLWFGWYGLAVGRRARSSGDPVGQ